MDKFRVGQKVRIINSFFLKSYIGKTCTITESKKLRHKKSINLEWYGYGVDIDRTFKPLEEHLEPVYDGDEKSSWSESLWKPKELIKE